VDKWRDEKRGEGSVRAPEASGISLPFLDNDSVSARWVGPVGRCTEIPLRSGRHPNEHWADLCFMHYSIRPGPTQIRPKWPLVNLSFYNAASFRSI
jgi:hypothetical protein